MNISVVIPAYNSEASLEPLIDRLAPVLADVGDDHEVILVNDGSRDGTADVVRRLARGHGFVRGIHLMRNYGQHNALLCGIRAARYEVIVTMDDDLQHPPEEIPKLLERLDKDHDVVYGTPVEDQHDRWRNLASHLTKFVLQNAMGVEVARQVSAFRAFRTPLRDAFADYRSPFVHIDALLTWGTTRFAAVPVRHDPRTLGASNYTVRTLITHAFNMLTGFTVLPLQFASVLGLVCAAFGLVVLLFVLGRYLIEGRVVHGFAFLASSIAIFSGAQLFALGLVGEYLARVHLRTMNKPPYAVAADTTSEKDADHGPQ